MNIVKGDKAKLLKIGSTHDEQQEYMVYQVLTDGKFTSYGTTDFVDVKTDDIILIWRNRITGDERLQCWLDKEGEIIQWYHQGVLMPNKIKEIVQEWCKKK